VSPTAEQKELAATAFIINATRVMSRTQYAEYLERIAQGASTRECIVAIGHVLPYEDLLCVATLTEEELVQP